MFGKSRSNVMAAVSDDDDGVKNKELPGIEFKKSRRTKSLTGTSLASIESLSMPLVCILSYSMKLVLNFFPPPGGFWLSLCFLPMPGPGSCSISGYSVL